MLAVSVHGVLQHTKFVFLTSRKSLTLVSLQQPFGTWKSAGHSPFAVESHASLFLGDRQQTLFSESLFDLHSLSPLDQRQVFSISHARLLSKPEQ